MIDCTLVTCSKVPELDPDDRLLRDELSKRGRTISVAVWDDPRVDWGASRLCVLRSTWDYYVRYREFIDWVGRAAAVTVICNDPRLLNWNAHKSYLRALERLGVPVVPTAWVLRGTTCNLDALTNARGWNDVVLKPARGASAHDVALVRRDGQAVLDRLAKREDVLVQPYLDSVTSYGERALIFIGGRYSHAVIKAPFDTELRISDEQSSVAVAMPREIAVASKAVEMAPGLPVYARVDLLRDDRGNVFVSELELIEPALYLAVHEPAVSAFADAIERELDAISASQVA